jgi:hypothetical protein
MTGLKRLAMISQSAALLRLPATHAIATLLFPLRPSESIGRLFAMGMSVSFTQGLRRLHQEPELYFCDAKGRPMEGGPLRQWFYDTYAQRSDF